MNLNVFPPFTNAQYDRVEAALRAVPQGTPKHRSGWAVMRALDTAQIAAGFPSVDGRDSVQASIDGIRFMVIPRAGGGFRIVGL